MNPIQSAPYEAVYGAVWSESSLFAIEASRIKSRLAAQWLSGRVLDL